jgi:hypothetical protein
MWIVATMPDMKYGVFSEDGIGMPAIIDAVGNPLPARKIVVSFDAEKCDLLQIGNPQPHTDALSGCFVYAICAEIA